MEGILAYGSASDRAYATEVLTGLSSEAIADGRREWLALEALVRAGVPYFEKIRTRLLELATAPKVEPHWILRACELAQQHDDRELIDRLTPQLLLIWSGHGSSKTDHTNNWSNKGDVAKLLRDTPYWADLEKAAFQVLASEDSKQREDWYAVSAVAFKAKSSEILKLAGEQLATGRPHFRLWHRLLQELNKRGWRVQIRLNRDFRVLHCGQEDPRPDADFRLVGNASDFLSFQSRSNVLRLALCRGDRISPTIPTRGGSLLSLDKLVARLWC